MVTPLCSLPPILSVPLLLLLSQILALNCLISAYSLSVLYLDGVKYGDRQMTALGMLMSVSFVTISRSKPLDKLSPVRPITSFFHPALFFSILGQVNCCVLDHAVLCSAVRACQFRMFSSEYMFWFDCCEFYQCLL